MMKIFEPRQALRVEDKFFPNFFFNGRSRLTPSARHIYSCLYSSKSSRPDWRPLQTDLAVATGYSVRTIQTRLKELETQGYLVIHRPTSGAMSYLTYELLVHEAMSDVEMVDRGTGTKSFPAAGETISPRLMKDIKEKKRINTPLSPLSCGRAPGVVGPLPEQRVERGESFPAGEAGTGCPMPSPSGREQIKQAARCRPSRPEPSGDFDRLWAAWPNRQAEKPARRLFNALRRRGRLPALSSLLATIQRFQAEDSAWKRNYVPRLDNWLRDERWSDEPRRTGGGQIQPCLSAEPVMRPSPVMADSTEEKNMAPMRRETILTIAAKPFCTWTKETIKTLLERADEFYAGASGTGAGGISGQPAKDYRHAPCRSFGGHGVRGAEKGRNSDSQLQAVLEILEGNERYPACSGGGFAFCPA